MQMSNRISGFQCSPIRRLVPYARDAKTKGIHVIHLNIGQPDIKTPVEALKAIHDYDDEIIASVVIPPHDFTYSYYRKIGMRKANAISKLSLSAAAVVKDGLVVDFRASSGAAGPKVIRSREAESMIIRRPVEDIPEIVPDFLEAWDHAISPHAMPKYRRNSTARMLTRFLEAIVNEEEPGIVE